LNYTTEYDYIIAGAGSAGLSLAWHMIHSGLSDKKILIVDKNLSPVNDKTWCFWHRGEPPFKNVIQKSWSKIEIYVNDTKIKNSLDEYPYYCIRSSEFSRYILKQIRDHSNVDLLESSVKEIDKAVKGVTISTGDKSYSADYIFQSCFQPKKLRKADIHYPLLQHFLGWEVETDIPVFDSDSFILMDFDETYKDGIAFIYLLPWSEHKALIEYTIFSPQPEQSSLYERKLELYLFNRFKLKQYNYSIKRTEYGKIPMQDTPYDPFYVPNVVNIGTVGGLTKPSTGYTFSRIQEHSRAIVDSLVQKNEPAPPPRSSFRYRAYDLWLLQILHDTPEKGLSVFHDLFRKNSTDAIFKFLSEKSSLKEDLHIMSSVPYIPFLKAIWKTKYRLFRL